MLTVKIAQKICYSEGIKGGRQNHLSTAQLFAVYSGSNIELYSGLRLIKEVFSIMRNDDIAKTAL